MKTATILKPAIYLLCIIVITGFVRWDDTSIGKINFILGGMNDVTLMRAGQSSWQNVKLYSAICNGDQIKTNKQSRCETKLNDKSIIRIGENTTFAFHENQLNKNIRAEIKSGRIWAYVKRLRIRSNFQVRTPTAVCAVRGTIYRIDADSSTRILVYQGSVDVGPVGTVQGDTSRSQEQRIFQPPHEVPGPTQVPGPFEVTLDQWVRIVAGFQIEVRPDGKYHKSKINQQIDKEDDWVKWNRQRDELE